MLPIPETVQLSEELTRFSPSFDVASHLQTTADQVQVVVPDCVGLSIAWLDQGVAFTLVASDEEIAVLDAVQYLASGPCAEAVERGVGQRWSGEEPLDERGWQFFAQATAARAVRSTLTLPLTHGDRIVGTSNLYAASDHAFEGHHETLAQILGASAADVVRNADLSFATRRVAEQSLQALRSDDVTNMAIGMLAEKLKLDLDSAAQRLADAAVRAGITSEQFAQALVAMCG